MPELAFFIGKGGVGKTTISSAYAAAYAVRNPRKKVLLLSTDPAHSLGDIFQSKLLDKPQRLRGKGSLYLWQINAEKHFRAFLKPYREGLLDLIESGTIFSRAEIEPLVETTLPGMAEVSALIAISELLKDEEYDAIVVDTAPIGHTLRMFEMPQHFVRFLQFLDLAGSRDRWLAQRFGEKSGDAISNTVLETWRAMAEQVRDALTAEHAQLFLVTSSEEFSLNEAKRSMQALAVSVPELEIGSVVLNRAVTGKTACKQCRNRVRATNAAEKFIKKNFPGTELTVAEDQGGPLFGFPELRSFGEHLFYAKALKRQKAPKPQRFPELKRSKWPNLREPLTFTLGKGGVGKTTVSASLGFHQRKEHGPIAVTVCSTDPAPSLDDIFGVNITARPKAVLSDKKFFAIEMDSVAEFRRWAGAMQQKIDSALTSNTAGGVHVDLSFDRKIFSSLLEIVPPGVDEIFSIFKILDLLETSKHSRVVIDMAPTGHALELLRMPERMLTWSRLLLKSLAPHRTLPIAQDVAVQIASLGQRVRELAEMLKGPRAGAYAVMLAEPMPDHQTLRLLQSLSEMQIGVRGIFVNRLLLDDATNCKRCTRARAWQAMTLAGLKKRYPNQLIYVLPDFGREVEGRDSLQKFTQSLWLLA